MFPIIPYYAHFIIFIRQKFFIGLLVQKNHKAKSHLVGHVGSKFSIRLGKLTGDYRIISDKNM